MGKKIAITGASGTVGKAAAEQLHDEGHEVVGLDLEFGHEDHETYDETREINLIGTKREGYSEDIQEAGKSYQEVREVLEDVDVVVHSAWNVHEENFDTGSKWPGNLEMFENVLGAAEKEDIETFVNMSSIHAGTRDMHPYTDNDKELEDLENEMYRRSIDPEDNFKLKEESPEHLLEPTEEKPDSPYGHSKIKTEHLTKSSDMNQAVNIRLGGMNEENDPEGPEDEPFYNSLYLDQRDLGDLLDRIAESDPEETARRDQVYAVSDNDGRVVSVENEFGWMPGNPREKKIGKSI